ncbi:unnamed protein product [Amoebophrya sp. A25]|nr:unnamed protein product [Amoebophrya sp. A25]|eukprot:GSA25T00026811001.1
MSSLLIMCDSFNISPFNPNIHSFFSSILNKMQRVGSLLVTLFAVTDAAAPLRVKVAGANHYAAGAKDIAALESRVANFMAATMSKGSFLQGKGGMATPGSGVKHALFLTQPMRSPSGVKINVVEKKPEATASAAADAQQAAFNMEAFVAGLSDLAGSGRASFVASDSLEGLVNRGTMARVATLGAYQTISMPVHVLAAVVKSACGCVDVYTESKCLLAANPVCPPLHSLLQRAFAMQEQVWNGVKFTTDKAGKVVGSPLIASPP